MAENKVQTGYQPEKYYMWLGFVIVLSFYLLFFYSSAIYSCFFRNPIDLLKNGGSDIALSVESIFDIKGIFTPSLNLFITYSGSFIFFVIGSIPHNVSEGKYKMMKIFLALFVSFIVDSLMAYKIDLGIHNLKEMTGVADSEWHFYSSINFYMVLIFGFCAYLVWGYAFEMMLKEKNKKTGDIRAALIIKGLKEEIVALRVELQVLETKIIELETQIKTIVSQLEQLKKDLENRMLNPDALSQNLTSFYMGWRQFLNGTSDLILEKVKCEETFNDFMQSQFNKAVILNSIFNIKIMKNVLYTLSLVFATFFLLISCGKEETKIEKKSINYTVVLDLIDRILLPEQLDKDFYLVEKYFKAFEENSRLNLVLTSKNRFSVKIIPQKNSPLNVDHYEDLLLIKRWENETGLLTFQSTIEVFEKFYLDPKILTTIEKVSLRLKYLEITFRIRGRFAFWRIIRSKKMS